MCTTSSCGFSLYLSTYIVLKYVSYEYILIRRTGHDGPFLRHGWDHQHVQRTVQEHHRRCLRVSTTYRSAAWLFTVSTTVSGKKKRKKKSVTQSANMQVLIQYAEAARWFVLPKRHTVMDFTTSRIHRILYRFNRLMVWWYRMSRYIQYRNRQCTSYRVLK